MNQFKTSGDVLEEYRRRSESLQGDIDQTAGQMKWLFAARGVFLLTALIGLGGALLTSQWIWALGGTILLALFLVTAYRHDALEHRRQIASLRRLNDLHSIARIERNWDQLPRFQNVFARSQEPFAKDLDLVGRASLYRWLCIAKTPMGQDQLLDWMLNGTDPQTIQERQEAAELLSRQPEYLDRLQIATQLLLHERNGPAQFVAWAQTPRWLEKRPALTLAARTLSLAFLGLIIGWALGWLEPYFAGISLCLILVANFALTIWYAGRIHEIFNSVAARQSAVWNYRNLFQLAGNLPGEAPLLERLRQGLREGERGAIDSIQELGLVAAMANMRRSGIFSIVYLIVQSTLLWDVHWLWVLERWHRRHAAHVKGWFATLGQIEAIACLGKLAHDQPQWNCATVTSGADNEAIITAQDLGHPLLRDDVRVTNDLTLGPPGTFLLVTGSNMSGKSTLLRSLGVNVVLAQMGAVTCTQKFQLPWVKIATSMRVQDSLAEGVSFYMAELHRLKNVITQARDIGGSDGPRLLYLLDEILQGTNSRERHIAVSRVVKHLSDTNAIGAVSTHDLELATAPELAARCQCVHFRESFEQVDGADKMVFDYQMRTGVATTTNALKLLNMVGIEDNVAATAETPTTTEAVTTNQEVPPSKSTGETS